MDCRDQYLFTTVTMLSFLSTACYQKSPKTYGVTNTIWNQTLSQSKPTSKPHKTS